MPDEISAEAEQGAKEEVELAAPRSERDFEKDAAFAQMRREMEQAQRENRKPQEALGKFNFHGSVLTMLDQVEAYHSGQSVEEIRRSRQARERLMSLEQENVALKTKGRADGFADDLAEIKKQYPDVKVRILESGA